MRIAFLLQDASGIYGAERATLDLATAINKDTELEVQVLLIRESRLGLAKSPLEQAFIDHDLPCIPLETATPFSWNLVRQIRSVIAAEKATLLHTVDTKSVVHGWLASGRGRLVPVCGTVHGWLFRKNLKERVYRMIEMQCLKRFRRVVVLSRYYEEYLRRQQFKAANLVRIPSGLDLSDWPGSDAKPADERKPLTVGLLGRLSTEKNIPMLLGALHRLQDKNIRGIISGEGPERLMLERRAAQQGLADRVVFTGYQGREDFFARVDVVVLCSTIENLPYTVLESMASGIPVVATRVGGLPDLIEDDVSGFLVDPGDEAALADRLGKLSADPGLRARLGRGARLKLEQEFSLDRCLEAHRVMYREMSA